MDAVAFSATAAPADTVAMASVMAINVASMGTLSDEDDASEAAAASLDAPSAEALAVLVALASAAAADDLPRKRREIGACRRVLWIDLAMMPLS